ncbi:hypothetical protein [Gemmatimonas sp.]|uniref:hypothetical protein n=1 Tax=Gemmatimonas sp. TaxID=1962908 RepID=UPI00356ABF77
MAELIQNVPGRAKVLEIDARCHFMYMVVQKVLGLVQALATCKHDVSSAEKRTLHLCHPCRGTGEC